MNRHNWTLEEDNNLKIVVQTNGSQDWTKNAQLLRQISTTAMEKKRTGKQCRQRWYNHLDPHVIKSQWTNQQQINLFQMHKLHGNKWKQLTKYLPGRTDNDIKNHFYSTLRRSLRRLNKYIGEKNSTSQMRQIKPSVLTFIINHIYSNESKQSTNKNLIDSLKQLPQLIFKFSSFKPIKQNMDKKIDESVKEKIISILNLVDQFKELYNKQKNQQFDVTEQTKKKKRSKRSVDEQIKNQNLESIQQNNSREDQSSDNQNDMEPSQLKHEYNSQQYISSNHLFFEKLLNQNVQYRKNQKQFTPIITIQRKPSAVEGKNTSKKLLLTAKTQQKIQQSLKKQQEKSHIRTLSFEEQDGLQNLLMPIQQPSLSLNENSNFFGDLVVIGKHIDPIQCKENTQQQPQYQCQIDQILYQNYQQ